MLSGDTVQPQVTQANTSMQMNAVSSANALPPMPAINTKEAFCNMTGEPFLCQRNFKIDTGMKTPDSNIDPFGLVKEVGGYLPDISERRELLTNTQAFKLGFGLDMYRQWSDDRGKGYNLPERIGRSASRGIQGMVISGLSNLVALPFAATEEATTTVLPGDGFISYTVAYVSTNKALSNWSEPYMQKRVFPLVTRLSSMIAR